MDSRFAHDHRVNASTFDPAFIVLQVCRYKDIQARKSETSTTDVIVSFSSTGAFNYPATYAAKQLLRRFFQDEIDKYGLLTGIIKGLSQYYLIAIDMTPNSNFCTIRAHRPNQEHENSTIYCDTDNELTVSMLYLYLLYLIEERYGKEVSRSAHKEGGVLEKVRESVTKAMGDIHNITQSQVVDDSEKLANVALSATTALKTIVDILQGDTHAG